MAFTLFEVSNAPNETAAKALQKSLDTNGFLPNLHRVLAASPETLEAYQYLHTAFQNTSFDATELTVVWQTINGYHECGYCVPAHTAIAHMMKVDEAIINDLFEGKTLQDPKLAALQATAREITDQRGHLSEATKAAFFEAGYSEQQILEIVLGLSQKVISNYTNHLAQTPLDEQFSKFAK